MNINRLIDDYNDLMLRDYWKHNLQYLLSPQKSSNQVIGTSEFLFNPSTYAVVSDRDKLLKNSEITNANLVHTQKFMNLSGQEIYECLNYQINRRITDMAVFNGSNDATLKERMKLYPDYQLSNIEKNEQLNPISTYNPTVNFYSLKYPTKDLFFLSFYVNSFDFKIKNDELIEMIKEQSAEYYRSSLEFFNRK